MRTVVGRILTLLAVLGVALLGTSCGSGTGGEESEVVDASDEFAERFERFRRASISYEEHVRRVVGGNALEEAPVTVISAFPESVSVGEHQITGRVDGRSIGCNDASGQMTCQDNGEIDAAAESEADIEESLAGLHSEPPRWTVTRGKDDDCYDITTIGDQLIERWGRRAILCFDPDGDLLVSETVDFEGGRDTVERVMLASDTDHDDVVAAFPDEI